MITDHAFQRAINDESWDGDFKGCGHKNKRGVHCLYGREQHADRNDAQQFYAVLRDGEWVPLEVVLMISGA